MIYLKLAIRNLARSLRDYAIYFYTVTVSVMIFYTFNSLKDQPIIVQVCEQAGLEPAYLAMMLGATSVLVAFIVAALVLYSNNFIIRRRKRELGMYLLLGMKQKTVARMLFVETLAVGIAACAIGILSGILLSVFFTLGFSVLMKVSLPSQLFSVSLYSIALTAVFYGLIFTGVGVTSSISVSRFTLAELMSANRTNEVYKPRNRWVTAVLGFISLGVLLFGYLKAVRAITSPNFSPVDPVYILVAGLMIVGSFGFFYASIGFIFGLLSQYTKLRWKGLNTFTMRQIMKKVNSNTLVLTATNLLLAMMITSVVFLVVFQTLFDQEKSEALPYTYAVLYLDPRSDLSGFDSAANINPENPVRSKLSVTHYPTETTLSDFVSAEEISRDDTVIYIDDSACEAIGLSEYNAVRAVKKLSPIQLGEREIAVQLETAVAKLAPYIQRALADGTKINLAGSAYTGTQVITDSFIAVVAPGACTLVAPDAAVGSLSLDGAQTTLMYDYAHGSDAKVEKSLEDEIYRVGYGYWTSRGEQDAYIQIFQTIIMFSGLYIEIILLIACASVLGLQQLIETVESAHHYQNISNLGADEGQIRRSIFQQVTFYFFAPVLLAVLHSLVALGAFNKLFGSLVTINPVALAATFGALILVYGLYYLITWWTCVNMTSVHEPALREAE